MVKEVELQVGRVSNIDISMAKPTVSVWLEKPSGTNTSANAKVMEMLGGVGSGEGGSPSRLSKCLASALQELGI